MTYRVRQTKLALADNSKHAVQDTIIRGHFYITNPEHCVNKLPAATCRSVHEPHYYWYMFPGKARLSLKYNPRGGTRISSQHKTVRHTEEVACLHKHNRAHCTAHVLHVLTMITGAE